MLGDDVAAGAAAAHGELLEVDFFLLFAEAGCGLEVDLYGIDLAALGGVAGEVEDAGAGFTFGQVILLIAGHATGGEVLGQGGAGLTVAVNHAVGEGVGLGAVEDVDMENVLTEEGLVADFADFEGAVLGDGNYVVEAGAFADGFVLLHAGSGEAFFAIHVEGLVGDDDFLRDDFLEGGELGLTLAAFAVFLLQFLEPLDGVFGEVFEVLLGLGDGIFEGLDLFVGFEAVELGDALDLDFEQAEDVVLRDLALEKFFVGLEAGIDGLDHSLPGLFLFDPAVDAFFDKDLFQ